MKRDMDSVITGLALMTVCGVPFLICAWNIWSDVQLNRHGIKFRAQVLSSIFISSENNAAVGIYSGDYSFEATAAGSSKAKTYTHSFRVMEKPGKEIDIRYLARNPAISGPEASFRGYGQYVMPVVALILGVISFCGLFMAVKGYFTIK